MGFKFTKEQIVGKTVKKFDMDKLNGCSPWDLYITTGYDYDTGDPIEKEYKGLRDVSPLYQEGDLQAVVFSGSPYTGVAGVNVCNVVTITNFTSDDININSENISDFIYEEPTKYDIEKLGKLNQKNVKLKIKLTDIDYTYEITAMCNSFDDVFLNLTIKECEDYSDKELDELARLVGSYYNGYKSFRVHVSRLFYKYKLFTIEELCEGDE